MARRLGLWWLAILAGALAIAAVPVVTSVLDRKRGPRWERLHPELRRLVPLIEAEARRQGLEVMFWDGWRDPQASAANIAAGTSKLKDPYNSAHVWGLAVDFVFRGPLGEPRWPADTDPRWRKLAAIFERFGLKSGGLMWGWDWPHAELPGYAMANLRARYGTDFLAFVQQSATMA
jgi:hypothetical protein